MKKLMFVVIILAAISACSKTTNTAPADAPEANAASVVVDPEAAAAALIAKTEAAAAAGAAAQTPPPAKKRWWGCYIKLKGMRPKPMGERCAASAQEAKADICVGLAANIPRYTDGSVDPTFIPHCMIDLSCAPELFVRAKCK